MSVRRMVMHRWAMVMCALGVLVIPTRVRAQGRVGADSATRWTRFGRDVLYGTAMSALFSVKDQLANDPPQWGGSWPGYGRRFASNAGEFVVQESATDALAAVMRRQPDYVPCRCSQLGRQMAWAAEESVTDVTPDGRHPVAVPRILGAYVGSFAQAAWRPATTAGRTQTALVNGTTSLLIGVGINMFHEITHSK